MKWVPCGAKVTLSRDTTLGFYKHRWEAFPWSCGLAVGWCDGISTGGIREWMCSARPLRWREICFGCLLRGQPAPWSYLAPLLPMLQALCLCLIHLHALRSGTITAVLQMGKLGRRAGLAREWSEAENTGLTPVGRSYCILSCRHSHLNPNGRKKWLQKENSVSHFSDGQHNICQL